MKYQVNDIYPCIQGEGCLTGMAMVLLRLQGCGVGCPWCDTKETWEPDNRQNEVHNILDMLGQSPKWIDLHQSEIVYYISQNCPGPKWVLLTGGEPAEQELESLCNALHDAGYKIALETSGTATGHVKASIDWVCVSPKIDMPGGKAIIPEAVAVADELKFVIGKKGDLNKLNTLISQVKLKSDCQICLQPVSQSKKATKLAIDIVQKKGWRLSIQTHKYLDLR